MTEKRFVAIGVEWTDGFIQDHISDRDLFNIGAVCNLLNDLSEENEQLKKENNALKNIIQDFIIKEFKITKEDIINGKGGDATDFSSVIDEFFNNEVNISEIQVELKGEKNND